MNGARLSAVDLMLGTALTPCEVDRQRVVVALRSAADAGERRAILQMVLDKRRAWLTYLTRTQRQWQMHTRRPSRARHHDSVAIRERYVRCA